MELVPRGMLVMDILKYSITKKDKIALFEFELENNIEPKDLSLIKLPDVSKEGLAPMCVVISGRGPIWLYGYMIHHFHPCKAVAVFDPRLEIAIVVESHGKEYNVGETLKIS